MGEKFIALVTGANRSIGLEVCRQLVIAGYSVILSGRDSTKAKVAARQIDKAGDVPSLAMDTLDEGSVNSAKAEIEEEYGRLDVLVNNAGGNFDTANLTLTVAIDYIRETLEMNLIGSWRIIEAMLPVRGPSGGFLRDGKRIAF